MYSVEHSFKDTLTLMSSQDWKVDTLPSVTFSYKNGVLFSLVQKSAFYSDRIDGKGVSPTPSFNHAMHLPPC